MTDQSREEEQAAEAARPAEEMRLRAKRPPVTRLSRKVLLGVGAAAAIGVGGAFTLGEVPDLQALIYNIMDLSVPGAKDSWPGTLGAICSKAFSSPLY